MSGTIIEQDRRFYEELLAPRIRSDFPEQEGRIAVGVAGEGSDCFGYDDEISRDHDFGVGVSLWLTDEDFASVGTALQTAYGEALAEWESRADVHIPADLNYRLGMRRGVQTIGRFYQNNLGFRIDHEAPSISDAVWFRTEEWRFAASVNGEVFRDDLGRFSGIRDIILGYYPDRIWRMRLANALHEYAAAMQANYARCMARRDIVAASYCRTRSIDAAMDILFLIRRRYAPYYKWKFRAFSELEGSAEITELIKAAAALPPDTAAWKGYTYDARKINTDDDLVVLFERIGGLLAKELCGAGLSDTEEPFLEVHCARVASAK